MFSRFTGWQSRLLRRSCSAYFLITLMVSQTTPVLAQVPVPLMDAKGVLRTPSTPVVPTKPAIMTLRQAVNSGDVSFTLSGDGTNTMSLRFEFANNTNRNMKVLIPAHEIFTPSSGSVQTMMTTRDRLISIPGSNMAGVTTSTDLPTVCVSPRSIPPPPDLSTRALSTKTKFFNMFKEANDEINLPKLQEALRSEKVGETKLSEKEKACVQEMVDSFPNIDTNHSGGLSASELKTWSITYTCGDYPDRPEWKKFAAICAAAAQLYRTGKLEEVLQGVPVGDQKSTISQLSIWTMLGKKTGKPDDTVGEKTFSDSLLQQIGNNLKTKPADTKQMMTEQGYVVTDKGVVVAKEAKAKKQLQVASMAIFNAVDLTLRTSEDPNLKVPELPTNSRWQSCCQVGERAFDSGDYTEAEELLGSALEEAETFGESDSRLATTLYDLARVYLDQGRYQDTEPPLARALRIQKKLLPDSVEIATTENTYGVLERNVGRSDVDQSKKEDALKAFSQSENFFTDAKGIRTKVLGANSKDVAEVLNNLAYVLILQDKTNDAKPLLDQALAIRIKEFGSDSPEVAEVNRNLAALYEKQGDYVKADKFNQLALQSAVKALGQEHPYVATIVDGIGQVAKLQNKDTTLYDKSAKSIRVKSLGGNAANMAYLPDDYQALSRIMSFAKANDKMAASISAILKSTSGDAQIDKADLNRAVKDKWAVVIGISQFKDASINLKYSANDAQAFRKYLIDDAHFAPDHVRLLLNEKATRENILSQIGENWLPRVAQPDDLVVIYFSGHGSPSTADQRGSNYLVAYNTDKDHLFSTGIELTQFAALVKSRVHSNRIVMVMDACHSGAAETGTKGLVRAINVNADEIVQGTGQLVICSSEPSQVSWESTRYPNGVFTHYLIEGLKLKGSTTPLGDAYDYMKAKVQQEVAYDRKGEQQVPVLKTRWEGKGLILGVPPTETRATPPVAPGEISIVDGSAPNVAPPGNAAKKVTPSAQKGTPAPAVKRPAPRKAG